MGPSSRSSAGVWLVLATAGALLAATAAIAQRGPATISMDEIRPGMRGHGLTVFRGTEPERFDVEVIDVLHNFRPDQDLILARTPHPILNRAIAVGGMSGSPIYFDGKLAGAYAYGWPFGIEPVIGITPIENMLVEMRRPVRGDSFPGAQPLAALRPRRGEAPAAGPASRLAGLPPYRGGARTAFDPIRAHRARLGLDRAPGPMQPVPASTPVMLGGFTDDAAALLGEELAPFGLHTLQAGGGQRRGGSAPSSFIDGGAIGVQLIRGDINATAIGTVTHVGGRDRVIAFGHPMMNAGEIGLPTSTARVLHIFQSSARSFKIAEGLEPNGTLVHDRQSAIVIDTDLQAATVPVHIQLNGIEGAPRTEWNVEVAGHRLLTPLLVFSALGNAVKATSADQTDVMYTARYRVDIEGHGPVELSDRGYMSAGPADARTLAGLRLFDLIDAAYGNPFEESRVTGIDLTLDVRFARDTYEIVDASVPSTEVDPGSDVDVRVVLQRFDEPPTTRTVTVHVPERAAGETLQLEIEPGSRVRVEEPEARDLGDIVEAVRDRFPDTSVVTSLKMPTRGLRFRGHVVRSLPRSALNALHRVSGTGPGRPFVTYVRRSVDVGAIVTGSAQINLNVRETPRER